MTFLYLNDYTVFIKNLFLILLRHVSVDLSKKSYRKCLLRLNQQSPQNNNTDTVRGLYPSTSRAVLAHRNSTGTGRWSLESQVSIILSFDNPHQNGFFLSNLFTKLTDHKFLLLYNGGSLTLNSRFTDNSRLKSAMVNDDEYSTITRNLIRPLNFWKSFFCLYMNLLMVLIFNVFGTVMFERSLIGKSSPCSVLYRFNLTPCHVMTRQNPRLNPLDVDWT